MKLNRYLFNRVVIAGKTNLLLLVMLGVVLAACGDATNTPATATTQSATSAAATTASSTTVASTSASAQSTTAAAGPTTPASNEIPLAQDEQEISFTVGKNTYYGTLLLPKNGAAKMPGALLIAGSGPTDRNGNSRIIPGPTNTLLNMARVLADQGVASLRVDKIGTGKTGLASYTAATLGDFGFDDYVASVRGAYDFLKNRPEVDPQRMMIIGHSEGGLLALVLADQLKSSGELKGIVLVAPQSKPFLQTIEEQLKVSLAGSVTAGKLTREQADAIEADASRANKTLLETGKLPADLKNPVLQQLGYVPANAKYLAQIGKYDPAKLAAGLPTSLPVQIFCGQKDQQVPCTDVQYLMQGFQTAGNKEATLTELPDVNHVLKEVPGAPQVPADYVNPNLKFSQVVTEKLAAFVKDIFKA
ncbi:MAG TPA: alpha/beta fold hydrolase [Chloroflexia bacterium]|nr:alpha/beta fold hydrolase [Chloroflexia bacterium]